MVFDHHREPFGPGIQRGSFRNCPREQHSVMFQSEVVMQMTGKMLLHAEETRLDALGLPRALGGELRVASRFWTLLEVTFLAVLFERHYCRSPISRRTGRDRMSMITAV